MLTDEEVLVRNKTLFKLCLGRWDHKWTADCDSLSPLAIVVWDTFDQISFAE